MDRVSAEQFLLDHGAAGIAHPGGTLLDHLGRVADQLVAWGAADHVVLAGLCHAAYGTDGFAVALLSPDRRSELREVIGAAAEELVYLYGSCDRERSYPALGSPGPACFRDRFTGETRDVAPATVRAFVEITAANELDVLAHNDEFLARYGPALWQLFTRCRDQLSPAAWAACQRALHPVAISHLDHLVLTVASIDRSLEFYQQTLGMTPVVFAQDRHALEFGNSKINLHRAEQPFAPHAAHPEPGTADLCLIAATPLPRVIDHLRALQVPIIEGPVTRTGARGTLTSIYLRDPDGNLIEISNY